MTRALSNDLRERVVAAVLAGENCRSVAARFGVSVSSVVKWSQRYRATGNRPRTRPVQPGGPPAVVEPGDGFGCLRAAEPTRLRIEQYFPPVGPDLQNIS